MGMLKKLNIKFKIWKIERKVFNSHYASPYGLYKDRFETKMRLLKQLAQLDKEYNNA